MRKIITAFFMMLVIITMSACSDDNKLTEGITPEPPIEEPGDEEDDKNVISMPLRVDGRYLKNQKGEIVNLHGFAQTYSPYFNQSKWTNYDVSGCLKYNKGMIDGILAAGWEMNFIRLHMDPYWSSEPGCSGRYEGHECFSEFRFRKYLDEVFIPMAEYAVSKGLYVVMRPPGVCPDVIAVGDDYNDYLITVWDIVSRHEKIKDNPYIMFELANEPINIIGKDGIAGANTQGHFDNLKIFFQSVTNVIRKHTDNIIWIPGLGYQSLYSGYANNPIEGENIGYAIHVYPGWFNSGDGFNDFQAGWDAQVKPVADFAPIMVTEMDWAPESYNSSWGKGVTGTAGGDGFGANFKYITDNSGNVSWLLFTDCHHLAAFKDEPGTPGAYTFLNDPEACPWPVYHWYKEYVNGSNVTSELIDLIIEGGISYDLTMITGGNKYIILKAIYADGTTEVVNHKAIYASTNESVITAEPGRITARRDGNAVITISYQSGEIKKELTIAINSTTFPLTSSLFNPSIYAEGSFSEDTKTLVTGQWGFGGWTYSAGADLSDYKYVIAELGNDNTCSVSFRLFDAGYWDGAAQYDFGSSRKVVVDLNNMYKQVNGNDIKIDPSKISIVGFWSSGGKPIIIKSVYLANEI